MNNNREDDLLVRLLVSREASKRMLALPKHSARRQSRPVQFDSVVYKSFLEIGVEPVVVPNSSRRVLALQAESS